MKDVGDKGDDSSFSHPTQTDVDTWNTNYYTAKHSYPPEEEEPTEVQVQALRVKVDSGRTPGMDFGVWRRPVLV